MTSSSPIFGDQACALCKNHKTPEDLNFHVTDSKTCADVHLALSQIDGVNNKDKCVAEQNEYRKLCCQPKKNNTESVPTDLGVGAAAIAGALLLWFVSKKVLSVKVGVDESQPSVYKTMKDAPVSRSRSKTKKSRSFNNKEKVLSVKVGVDESQPSEYKTMKEAPVSRSRSKTKKSRSFNNKEKSKAQEEPAETNTEEMMEDEEDGSILAMWNGNNT
jgi:hypothetical protein